ncbi:anti-sigma factor family protein [Pseudanabaena sp. PCC 6802]|uniref:anti-sigma factor family protein n=1 Tax=Pseudanabaena sp. PCC 6802 TaxID=118173 RepID=UPI0003478422|nr:zf-HC2 domain-containing protein [Pseudanabaena sp. PCC 6802]
MNNLNDNKMHTPDPEEQFELLSLYMDNETSPAEKRQVEQWLATEPSFRNLYHQQLRLRQLLIDLPVPGSTRVEAQANRDKTEVVVNRVLAKLEERSRHRRMAWGGIAAVAVLVGAVGSILTFNSPTKDLNFSTASNTIKPQESITPQEPLLLAMERPLIPMPKSMAVTDIK